MQAEFSYASCPRVCPHAFLKIAARNDSAYALLGGPADIFLDGNFCSKVRGHPTSKLNLLRSGEKIWSGEMSIVGPEIS